MIVPSLGVKVLIVMKPTDFRKGMMAWPRWFGRRWAQTPTAR